MKFGVVSFPGSCDDVDARLACARVGEVVALWHATLEQASYVWLTGDTVAQIPWNSGLYGYFRRHFRLIGLAGQPVPSRDVPRPGLYLRN